MTFKENWTVPSQMWIKTLFANIFVANILPIKYADDLSISISCGKVLTYTHWKFDKIDPSLIEGPPRQNFVIFELHLTKRGSFWYRFFFFF